VKTPTATPDPTALNAYAVWLEMGQTHSHEGSDVQLRWRWWPQTPPDIVADDQILSALVLHSGGGRKEITLAGYAADQSVRFLPPVGGLYHVILRIEVSHVVDRKGKTGRDHPEAPATISATHYAQCVVPVGHHAEGVPKPSGLPLEIRAARWQHWRAGDVLPLAVVYRGEVLRETSVDVVVQGPAGRLEWPATTGPGGYLALRATEPGRYLVIARHQAPGDEKDGCDQLRFTATLAFMVTK